ncbi:sulfite oxidase-like oxidoreductase [Paenibacillus validus]|uniref:Molybdopterin-dependent oxidoreductase n=1 Tax=Paenibacillus validus TaxID=44253 RepID=A0A7X2ZG67_9BACL|nr:MULTISPECIES: sulfite oxidase-like oxidoreductase [Paenibacillus]MED4601509.1 sulfite oxidase-like oxidoreductase [Paenibacillus validus]MED4607916.1 sulfite oxidase-like oxidoreductase [Paenibacillus validus]MUG73576.1 molybdopterin-dependent oxidoreductase [Paenibacillus validus]
MANETKFTNDNIADRVPPGQTLTDGFPVLHYGSVPYYNDMSKWDLRLFGLVEEEVTLSYKQFLALPMREFHNDIHCVTTWSKLDNVWEGVSVATIMELVKLKPEAKYVMLHAEHGWTTNLPLDDFLRDTTFLGIRHNGQLLTPEHGAPVRAVVPHLYFWKSAKWLRGIEFMEKDKPGFWERNGYHMYGDPFKEQRYDFD